MLGPARQHSRSPFYGVTWLELGTGRKYAPARQRYYRNENGELRTLGHGRIQRVPEEQRCYRAGSGRLIDRTSRFVDGNRIVSLAEGAERR